MSKYFFSIFWFLIINIIILLKSYIKNGKRNERKVLSIPKTILKEGEGKKNTIEKELNKNGKKRNKKKSEKIEYHWKRLYKKEV